MKKITLITICLLNGIATVFAQVDKSFSLECNIAGLKDNTNISLIRNNSENPRLFDTIGRVTSKSGKFLFTGKLPVDIDFYYLRFANGSLKILSSALVLVNEKMKLTANKQGWPNIELNGSEPHLAYREVMALNEKMIEELRAQNADETTAISKKEALFKSYAKNHLNSPFSPFLISEIKSSLSVKELADLYNSLGMAAKAGYFGVQLKDDLQKMSVNGSVKIGGMVPDFKMKMQDGKVSTIYELASKNEITLIDFWASSCVPCRAEVPNLKEVYATYHGKGFNILGLSSDKKETDWKKALLQDNTPWFQALDTEESYRKIFNISGIPSYMMIDRNGKILALELFSSIKRAGPVLRGEGLHETVKKLLKL